MCNRESAIVTESDPNILESDILLRPTEVEMMAKGANPMSASHREEDKELHVDPNGFHSRWEVPHCY